MHCFLSALILTKSCCREISHRLMLQIVFMQGFYFIYLFLSSRCAVLKSSHGSANLSVLGNRSGKNESSPSVDRQVCSAAPFFQRKHVSVHGYFSIGSTRDAYLSDHSQEAEHRGSGRRDTKEASGQSQQGHLYSHSQWAV